MIKYLPVSKKQTYWEKNSEIADTIDLGIEVFHELINGPYDWKKYGDRQLINYSEPEHFVSHNTIGYY